MREFAGKRALVVCAVSTPEQAEDDKESMDAQERDGLAWCAAEGCDVVDVVRVPGFSRNYLTFRELMDAAEAKGEMGPSRLWQHIQAADFDVMVVRATNRLSREQSLNAEIIARVIRAGATIFSFIDGHIDKRNYRPMATITGYRDAIELDEMKRRRALGIVGRAKHGLPIAGKPPMSHRIVRNTDSGAEEGVALRPEYAPLWNDLAGLLLDNVPYHLLEVRLFERWGYGEQGKPYPQLKLYKLLFNEFFWGNNAIRWTHRSRPYWRGTWVFDSHVSPPDGIEVFYGTHTPVYSGDLAERVKAELRRRSDAGNIVSSRRSVGMFTGLVVCDYCYGRACYARKVSSGKTFVYLICSHFRASRRYIERCDNGRAVRESALQVFLDAHLRRWLDQGRVVFEDTSSPPITGGDGSAVLEAAEQLLTKRQTNLMLMAADATDDDLRKDIWTQILTTKDELKRCREQLSASRREANADRRQQDTQRRTLEQIKDQGLTDFWQSPPLFINQTLHALLQTYRIYIRDGTVGGFVDASLLPGASDE